MPSPTKSVPVIPKAKRDELRELLAKATPGPWTPKHWAVQRATPEDGALIVALQNAAPALLDAAERGLDSEARHARLVEAVRGYLNKKHGRGPVQDALAEEPSE